ncbi:MAG TPA: hypothetical protein DDY14_02760 [Chromatiaceae bacterium]|jgi:hypothetical protein|nr:MAG: hypothetical protein N838_10790 [Thiohalocapsa sp. PB-PSB1]QQO55781.1 MAG: hypothetical protein N838_22950 [Thiohalocapsa sp. PB-PSB1]HBG94248.1 hypothetical protein [Chromatiaceae bacterium]HCS89304.1 hypothetical protein [Chromatiaceae bacterium]
MNLKLPRIYKLLLSLALIIGPFTWLMFTEDGRRRSDLFILHLLGAPSFNIGYDRLHAGVTETDISTQFPRVDFQCDDRSTHFGARVCAAKIASFNGLPARAAMLFYQGGTLNALQLDYRMRYHKTLVNSLRNGLGAPLAPVGGSALVWNLDQGVVMLSSEQPERESDAALVWLTPTLAASRQ